MQERERVLILGAAGRDFHNFNTVYRDAPNVRVVGFTATQIPQIDGRRYPPELAGALYPDGIPIFDEADLERLVRSLKVDTVVLAYSDLAHVTVGHLAARALASGADFRILGPVKTMLWSSRPVVAITAVRTGCGKSQTTRYISRLLREAGLRTVAIRHPMPYGDLAAQRVQRFASLEDIDRAKCTIEEREEYELHVENQTVLYAGVDYGAILRQAEQEADVVLWDGGNNDWPFYHPDLWIVVADPLRPGHELTYFPGETNFRAGDVIVINKANTAEAADVKLLKDRAAALNPASEVVVAASEVSLDDPKIVQGKRVLVIEDGPTLTHGEMSYGAGTVAAKKFGAKAIIDPRPFAVGSIRALYDRFPHIGNVVPAMGYYPEQIAELQETIRRSDCDAVVSGTPFNLLRVLEVDKPCATVSYELEDMGAPLLRDIVSSFITRRVKKGGAA
ncbi:MAG: cyclic 2,3-diphosphoglycerate synthase [Polyangia bacterium]|jgi:predicted GTPase|nr:cyclic 2,3-diphosphoglycerate synthase [Polyangia bacterium]